MLNHCRALDLTDNKGYLCGKVLADLGVDVIKIEPPGGDPTRNQSAFWDNDPDPEKSLTWYAYNSDKRGITLDIETADGQALFKKLVKTADFVIESYAPGYLDDLGLGYEALCEVKKDIIVASITPFGLKGPYSQYKYSDLIVMGMSGTLYMTGESNEPPVQMSMPQAGMHAGADAAVGIMVAYYNREKTGEGQQVDVSMQQSAAWFQANAIPAWELNQKILPRAGAFRAGTSADSVAQRQVWPCKDGYVFFNILGGKTGAKTLRGLTGWMDEEGMATAFLKGMDWDNFDMFTVSKDIMDQITNPIYDFFLTHTRKELLKGAVPRLVSIGPLFSMQDLIEDESLQTREFWTQIDHPELGTRITYPKQFVHSSESSCITRLRAPLIGEHNAKIYGDLGLSKEDLTTLKQAGII